jgi:hypothetical protein
MVVSSDIYFVSIVFLIYLVAPSTDSSDSSENETSVKSCAVSNDVTVNSRSESSDRKLASDKPKEVTRRLTEQEMNQLGAKILKAELIGNEVIWHNLITLGR